MYEKEGTVKDSVDSVITLITGVGVAVLVLIFVSSLGGQTYNLVESDLEAIGVNAGTTSDLTALNSTAASLTHQALQGTPTVTQAGETITGNFTFDLEAGTATLVDNANNNTAFNFSYNWKNETVGRHVKNGIMSSFEALEQTGDYLPIIVLAVVIALVLFLVLNMGSTGSFKNGGGNQAL